MHYATGPVLRTAGSFKQRAYTFANYLLHTMQVIGIGSDVDDPGSIFHVMLENLYHQIIPSNWL